MWGQRANGWFAAALGLRNGSTRVILSFKMKMQHPLHELLETVQASRKAEVCKASQSRNKPTTSTFLSE
jgi:hypothetical protein